MGLTGNRAKAPAVSCPLPSVEAGQPGGRSEFHAATSMPWTIDVPLRPMPRLRLNSSRPTTMTRSGSGSVRSRASCREASMPTHGARWLRRGACSSRTMTGAWPACSGWPPRRTCPVRPRRSRHCSLEWEGRPLRSAFFLLYGPVVVAAAYRGKGVARGLFTAALQSASGRADVMVAFIEPANQASWRVHVDGFGMAPWESSPSAIVPTVSSVHPSDPQQRLAPEQRTALPSSHPVNVNRWCQKTPSPCGLGVFWLVGLTGFEPVASSLSGMRSNQLSYSPAALCGVSRAPTPED